MEPECLANASCARTQTKRLRQVAAICQLEKLEKKAAKDGHILKS
jgi:hypothetical protein